MSKYIRLQEGAAAIYADEHGLTPRKLIKKLIGIFYEEKCPSKSVLIRGEEFKRQMLQGDGRLIPR